MSGQGRPLHKEGLCAAKLCAFREKDINFVAALLDADLVDPAVTAARLSTVPTQHAIAVQRALDWLASHR